MNAGEELMRTLMKERDEADRLKHLVIVAEAEVAHLEKAMRDIAAGEEVLGDIEPAIYAGGTIISLEMRRGHRS